MKKQKKSKNINFIPARDWQPIRFQLDDKIYESFLFPLYFMVYEKKATQASYSIDIDEKERKAWIGYSMNRREEIEQVEALLIRKGITYTKKDYGDYVCINELLSDEFYKLIMDRIIFIHDQLELRASNELGTVHID